MQDLTKRAVILSAMPVTPALSAYLQPGDTVVACDAGYRNAAVLGIQPDLIVGDFDSAPKPETTGDMIILPHVKDDTDTHYAAKWLCERGYRHIVMLGALGGKRMEHTFSNVSTALYLASNNVDVTLADEHSELHILCPGKPLTLQKKDWMYLYFVSRQAANIAKERLDVSFRVPAGWAAGRCIDSRRVLSIERCNADTGLPPWHQQ